MRTKCVVFVATVEGKTPKVLAGWFGLYRRREEYVPTTNYLRQLRSYMMLSVRICLLFLVKLKCILNHHKKLSGVLYQDLEQCVWRIGWMCVRQARKVFCTQASTEKCCLLFKKCYRCKRHIDQYSEEVLLKRPWQRETSQW